MMPQPRPVITIFTILFAEHKATDRTSDNFKHLGRHLCPQNTGEVPSIICGRGVGRQDFPVDPECMIERCDGYDICCRQMAQEDIITSSPSISPSVSEVFSSCPINTKEVSDTFCRQGLGRTYCHRGLECVIDRGDIMYAISDVKLTCCSRVAKMHLLIGHPVYLPQSVNLPRLILLIPIFFPKSVKLPKLILLMLQILKGEYSNLRLQIHLVHVQAIQEKT